MIELGNWGYWIGALGILIFTGAYLTILKRWWKDTLGLVIGLVLITISAVVITSSIRLVTPGIQGWFLWIRTIVFWAFGVSIWTGLITFVWSQFFAPRRATRRENKQ